MESCWECIPPTNLKQIFSSQHANSFSFKLKQNSHMWIRVNLPNSTRAGQHVGMDGFQVGKNPENVNKLPTNPCWNYGCHLWISPPLPPCLCNLSANQVFLSFHSNIASLVRENSMSLPPPAIGDNQKCPPQAALDRSFMLNPQDVPQAFPLSIQINIDS